VGGPSDSRDEDYSMTGGSGHRSILCYIYIYIYIHVTGSKLQRR